MPEAEFEAAPADEADDLPLELELTDDNPFKDPDETPPQNGKSKLGDDWPFSMN